MFRRSLLASIAATLLWAACDLDNTAAAQAQLQPVRAFATSQPTDPTLTASATKVMMGLGVTGAGGGFRITPAAGGLIQVDISGSAGNATTADGVTWEIDFGPVPIAAAPANGAVAPSGTVVCTKSVTFTALTGNLQTPFSASCTFQGTPGTTYWVDIGLLAVTGGNASIKNLTGFLREVN